MDTSLQLPLDAPDAPPPMRGPCRLGRYGDAGLAAKTRAGGRAGVTLACPLNAA